MVYLAIVAVGGGIFTFCSFWIFHDVDLEHGSRDLTGLENAAFG